MIFHRRVIQEELNNLRRHLQGYEVDRLVKRLNEPDRERLSRMWEVVVLSSLCDLGQVDVEKEIEGGNRPDVHFNGEGRLLSVARTHLLLKSGRNGITLRHPFLGSIETASPKFRHRLAIRRGNRSPSHRHRPPLHPMQGGHDEAMSGAHCRGW